MSPVYECVGPCHVTFVRVGGFVMSCVGVGGWRHKDGMLSKNIVQSVERFKLSIELPSKPISKFVRYFFYLKNGLFKNIQSIIRTLCSFTKYFFILHLCFNCYHTVKNAYFMIKLNPSSVNGVYSSRDVVGCPDVLAETGRRGGRCICRCAPFSAACQAHIFPNPS